MKSKQEILDHLATTVYTHNARRSIVQWMLQNHVVDYKCQIKFASHVYNREGVKMTEGLSFEDFEIWVYEIDIENWAKQMHESFKEFSKAPTFTWKETKTLSETLADAWAKCIENINKGWHVACNEIIAEDFQIGDAVKYMPTPDLSTTEYVEAIAHGSDCETYLCLSNGEYVRPCYCVKYKVQGEERRKLIDKLNEVI